MATHRRTKIVCTIGPACEDEDTLYRMILAGMDVARFNFSHGTHEEHGRRIDAVRQAAARVRKRIGIMLDTRGPEIRLGLFEGGRALLQKGQTFTLTTQEVLGNSRAAHVGLPGFPGIVSAGSRVLLDDGNIALLVTGASGESVTAEVLNSGVISDRKKVSVPGASLDLPIVDERDVADLRFGARAGVDFVAASFVRSAADVAEVRRTLGAAGSRARIISKIECIRGVERLNEILEASDGLMVARGDLGIEFPPEEIPLLQKKMIAGAVGLGKPVVTATQMLESMVEHPHPTRAEASDVANAILDGTDAVMLSAETASGRHPVESVEFMARIAARAEAILNRNVFLPLFRTETKVSSVTEAVSRSVLDAADDLEASAVVTPTESGYTARMVARFRPRMPIYATTPHEETAGWLTLVWGVETLVVPALAADGAGACPDVSEVSLEALRQAGLVQGGDLCVITKGVPPGVSGTTNVMEIRTVSS